LKHEGKKEGTKKKGWNKHSVQRSIHLPTRLRLTNYMRL
jgi:hypothetical protein